MFEVFEYLLKKKGITQAEFSRETGIKEATISTWKRRGSIGRKHLPTIAAYFNVSIDYLLTGEQATETGYYTSKETAKTAQEIFENPDLRLLFDIARTASPEDVRYAAELLKRLKGTNE